MLLAPAAAGLVTVNAGAVTATGNAVVATSAGGGTKGGPLLSVWADVGDTQGYGLRAGFRC